MKNSQFYYIITWLNIILYKVSDKKDYLSLAFCLLFAVLAIISTFREEIMSDIKSKRE